MCFLKQVYNFLVIKFKWKRYLNSKLNRDADLGYEEKHDEFNIHYNNIKAFYLNQKRKHKFLLKCTTSRTFENYVFKAILGWFIGTCLAVSHFYSTIFLGEASTFWSFLTRLPILVFITTMLAFTESGRCYLFLAPLQLFSAKGQMFVLAQVMLLVMGGPMLNLKHNLNVIQESSSCQQREVAAAAVEVADMLFGPFSAFKQAAMEVVNGIKSLVEKFQNILLAFKRTVMAVADAIQDATRWINSKINGCKNTVGTTYQHCMEAFTWMYDECKVSVPSVFVKMCAVTEFASGLCSSVKPGEYLCDLVYFTVDPLVTTISQRISRLWDRAYTLMFFKVNIHHEYSLDSNSKSIAEELKNKVTDALATPNFMWWLSVLWEFLAVFNQFLFFWFMLQYRIMYKRRVEFDNYYISKRLISLDKLHMLEGKESLFPLRRVEKNKYTKVTSLFLLKKEIKTFSYPYIVIFYTVFVLLIVAIDFVLYKITEKCRVFMLALMQSLGSRTEVSIEGSGFIAELSRRVIRSINHMDSNFYHTHFMPCMPNPKTPNSWTNKKIIFLLVLLWFTWIFKPFVMRYRHRVMDWYHPLRADERAKWLYNSIALKRVTFMTLIRVKLKSKFGGQKGDISIADVLRARYPWIVCLIGRGLLADECMICAHVKPPLYRCTTPNCLGIFCDDCVIHIRKVCSLCRNFMDIPGLPISAPLEMKVKEATDKGIEVELDDDEDVTALSFDYQAKLELKVPERTESQSTGSGYSFISEEELEEEAEKETDKENKPTYKNTFEMF